MGQRGHQGTRGQQRRKGAAGQEKSGVSLAGQVRDYQRRSRELYEISKTLHRADFSLADVLRLILDAAVRLSNARYGALGVFDESGERLADFLTVGIDAATKAAIGPLPTGRGFLGTLDWDDDVIRVKDLTRHPAFTGFPPHLPPMRSFLGVSIRVDGRLFGRIYLTDKKGRRREFSELDEQTVAALGVHACLAIEDRHYVERLQTAEALYWSTMASLPVSVVRLDQQGTIRFANPRFYALIQRNEADIVGRSIASVLPVDAQGEGMDELLQLARVQGEPMAREVEWVNEAGDPRILQVCIAGMNPAAAAAADFVLIIEDISARKRTESGLVIQSAVTRCLAESLTLAQATRELLRIIGEHTGWEVGVLWAVDRPAGVLRCAEVWAQHAGLVTEFAAELRRVTLSLGGGLPGQVWATGQPAWVADVGRAADCPVAPLAVRSGLRGVFAFALRTGSDVEGVMVFLSPQIREPGQDLLHILTALGGQIGQFMARKRAEADLHEVHDALEHAVQGIARLDVHGRYLAVNALYASLLGFTSEELIGAEWPLTVHPDDRAAVSAAYQQMRSVGKGQAEVRALRKDGSVFHKRVVMIKANDWEGRLAGHYCFMEDITERKQAEEALILYKKIIAYSSEAIGILDLQGGYLEQNGAHQLLTGHTGDELRGHTPAIHLGEEVLAAIFRDLTSTGVHRGEYEGHTKDGKALILDLSIFTVCNSAGEPMCYVEIERDMTKSKSMEQQLRQTEKMAAMGMLIAGVSHELNNPLFALSGYIELASENVRSEEYQELAENLAAMREATERATAMVRRFLGVAHSPVRQRELCAVNVVVEQALELVANDCLIHRVRVSRDLAPDLPLIEADAQELRQVLLNLFTNARQAMTVQGRGTLTVTTSLAVSPRHPVLPSASRGAWIDIRVQDDGSGIAPEQVSRVFEPFFTTKPVGEGTGLGLSISHRIVTEHGGTLTCQSEPGRGATFMIRLPVGTSDQQEAES